MSRDRSSDPPKAAAELMAELKSDPEYLARIKSKQDRIQRLCSRVWVKSNHSLLTWHPLDLQWILLLIFLISKMNYKGAIPILLAWLPRISDPAVKPGVIRAITVPWAKPMAAPLLIQEFRKADDPTGTALHWVIAGNASLDCG